MFNLLRTHKSLINSNGDIIGTHRKVTDIIEKWASFDSLKALMIVESR